MAEDIHASDLFSNEEARAQFRALLDGRPPPAPPERIGPYRIVREIGRGGMGVVYLAQQEEPIRRTVAVKLVRWGLDAVAVIDRFEVERQALALMNHQGIARILDASSTGDGRPYFVMEHVDGPPLTEYCDGERLPVPRRLELFVELCDGVQHAHQKGVIHRDLKPSNVLVAVVDGRPIPKIIDFGIAKATSQSLTERTLSTELGDLVGTPEYMSPEQADPESPDIDTRTDVYSLGMVLYELLAGTLPFDFREIRRKGIAEVQRTILEAVPPLPSRRILELSAAAPEGILEARGVKATALSRELRGDLDWIVVKAIDKDPGRRYASSSELAADIRRHLAREPVAAGPPSRAYRIGRFVARHRLGVGAAAALFTALVLGLLGTGLGLVRAVRSERAARASEATAQRVKDFLVRAFEASDPREARGATITAREVLDRGRARIREDLREEPELRGSVMAVIGQVYGSLGLYGDAEPLLRDSLSTLEDRLGSDHPEVATVLMELGRVKLQVAGPADAEPFYRRALAIRERTLGPQHPEVANSLAALASTQYRLGRPVEAERLARRALAIRERSLGRDDPSVADTLIRLAGIVYVQGHREDAKGICDRAVAILERALGPDHPDLARPLVNAGWYSAVSGDPARAESLYRRALEIQERTLGSDHPELAVTWDQLARLARDARKSSEAEDLIRRSLALRERTLDANHPSIAWCLFELGILKEESGDFVAAAAFHERALAMRERGDPGANQDLAASLARLGGVYVELGRYAEAEPLLRKGADMMEETTPPGQPADRAWARQLLARTLRGLGRKEDAAAQERRATELVQGPGQPQPGSTELVDPRAHDR